MEQAIYNIIEYSHTNPYSYLGGIFIFVAMLMLILSARRDRENEKIKYQEFCKKYKF